MRGHLIVHRLGQETFEGLSRIAAAQRGERLMAGVDVELDAGCAHRATSARWA
jgi:hypothetical protein